MKTETILVTILPTDAIWLQARDAFAELDVEADSEAENIYDVRTRDGEPLENDEVFLWGRDGWSAGFWHAKLHLERNANGTLVLYATRGSNKDAMSLIAARKFVLKVVGPCMTAREVE